MTRRVLLVFHWAAGLSDASTGAMLMAAPAFTLGLMGLAAPADAMPFVSFVGAFVLAVGLAYLYGARLVGRECSMARLEAVWLVTAMVRSSVAVFVLAEVLKGALSPGWLTIAVFDAACVAFQALGLRNGWIRYAAQ
ncbi:MAG TPA: hypothetical protein VMV57_08995 [Terracidiphilus sp.]|nr:hypothetical protein [Terracidiphilus sp.]